MPLDQNKRDDSKMKCPGPCKGLGTVYDRKANKMKNCPRCGGEGKI